MANSILKKLSRCMLMGVTAIGFTFANPTIKAAETSSKDVVDTTQSWSDSAKEAWMQGKIETIFTLNKHLAGLDIHTDVKGNLANLTGSVTNQVQKELAQQLALSVEGITDVKNQLEINPSFRIEPQVSEKHNGLVQAIEDASTIASIKTQFMMSDLKSRDIDIETTHGVVTINGVVESEAHSDLADTIARNTDGVTKVVNNLKIIDDVANR